MALTVGHLEQRDGRWVIVDLRGKHGRLRTIAVPAWVKQAVDLWCAAAGIPGGRILRSLNRHGPITGASLSPQAVLLGNSAEVEFCVSSANLPRSQWGRHWSTCWFCRNSDCTDATLARQPKSDIALTL